MDSAILERYKREIAYLQSLLDANGIPYDYEAYSKEQNKASQKVVELLPLDISPETAKFFFSMFHGRVDVYARRSKYKGYFPECSNFWKSGICPKKDNVKIKCAECSARAYAMLNSKVLMQHFKGEREDSTDVLGVYVMLKDNTCRFIVLDFDDHNGESDTPDDWQKEVDTMRDICRMCGIDCLVERSRSGYGAHIWIFFSEAVPSEKARKFGNALITKGTELVSVDNFIYYDRLLPMQDVLPEGGLGNLIALPWQGRAMKNGNSVFVDNQWSPIPNQMTALKNVRKLSLQEIESYIQEWDVDDTLYEQEIENDNTSVESTFFERNGFHHSDALCEVKIVLKDGIYINTNVLRPRLQNSIRRLAAYSNPEFYKNLKQGFSTKGIPRVVYCGYDDGDYIVLPRGCGNDLLSRLEDAGIEYQIEDKRQTGKSIDVSFNGKLYPEQMAAASAILTDENGILSAATAFGKTVVGAYLISQRRVNTLILVHNVEIMNNWLTDLGRFLSINEDFPTYTTPSGRLKQRKSLIGTFSSQKSTLTGIIDIVMVSSLGKDDNINPLVTQYGMVIMDECHHGAAYTSESVLRAITAKYVYGLTATTKRDDGQERKMFMQLGLVRYKYTAKDRAEKQGIGHYIYPRFTRIVDVSDNISITEALSLVSGSELRNLQIVADVKECIHLGRTPIVMTKRKEHAAILFDMLSGVAEHTFLLQGGGGLKERAKLREQMAAVPADESMLVVAIGQYVGEGFNYPRLDTLLLAMPISFEGNVEQYAGRLNRDYEGKKDVIIFDYIDRYVPILERMYLKRLRTYKRIGFEICSQVVDKQHISNSIYDSATYSEIFSQDVTSANSSVIISSPGLGTSKVWQFLRHLPMIQERGVKVIVITMSPSSYPEDAIKHQEELVQTLRLSGVVVKTQNNCKEHFAVIDDSIVWYGSMNFLSRERDDDNIMRIESKSIAQELLLRYAQANR